MDAWIARCCPHLVEPPERCVYCGPDQGDVFLAWCHYCDPDSPDTALTWHSGRTTECLRCGTSLMEVGT